MGDTSDETSPWLWTRSQRRVLVVLVFALCVVFGFRHWLNRAYISDPQPLRGPRYDEVVDKIDPNVADAAALSALPMIGEKRAQDIIDYRERRRAASPGGIVFSRVEDFLQIHGFGRASVESLRPHLMFPSATTGPSTRP